jgi:hypothetical protein
VWLDSGDDCALDSLDKCTSCTPNVDCNNPCEGPCEVCFTQDPDDLPDTCDMPECPDGITPCFDEMDCGVGEFCQTGCCVPIP